MAEIPESASLRMARGKAATSSGEATIELVVPNNGRLLLDATVWFGTQTDGDYVKECKVFKPNGEQWTEITSYVDTDMGDTDERGWFFRNCGSVIIEGITGREFIPAGYKLKLVAVKASGEDTLYANVRWGKRP